MKIVVERAWRSVTGIRPQAYEFVVMPNHVHGIVWLAGSRCPNAQHGGSKRRTDYLPRSGADDATVTAGAARLRSNVSADSLGAKVRAFKAATTRRINARRGTPSAPVWQPGYYEHVVRNDADLNRIRQYILDNPAKWADDPENPGNN
jgi:REP element-mobilizing transposase RayT